MGAGVPSGSHIFRPSNSHWQFNGSSEVVATVDGALRGYVDFDRLPSQFLIALGFTGKLGPFEPDVTLTFRVRIGGTIGGVDGDIALQKTAIAGAASTLYGFTQIVTNVWSGRKIVKLSGQHSVVEFFDFFIADHFSLALVPM